MNHHQKRAFLVVLDGVGVGNAPDASLYGDEGSDTLGNLARRLGGLDLPQLQALGLGHCGQIEGVSASPKPAASSGRMEELSAGKDSITGHWELAGLLTDVPFPTYPDGFPEELVELIEEVAGRPVMGNEVASGTEIMQRLGAQHMQSGHPILYTSADSVVQLLAHEEVLPLEELYRICSELRSRLEPPHRVGRVIARPFVGEPGNFRRTANRRDYALEPHGSTLLDQLRQQDIEVWGVGKVEMLFGGRGFSGSTKTANNAEGIDATASRIAEAGSGLTFTNLLDFDQEWGHRNDVEGFAEGLRVLDGELPRWTRALRPDDLLILTADHGNDPTTPSTDHSRERVPLLAMLGGEGVGSDLGTRKGFVDVAATVAEHFGLPWKGPGSSFLSQLG